MKKADYNRVLSLYKNSNVTPKVCIQIIIQLSTDSHEAALYIARFLRNADLLK